MSHCVQPISHPVVRILGNSNSIFALELFEKDLQEYSLLSSYEMDGMKIIWVSVTIVHQMLKSQAEIVNKSDFESGPDYGHVMIPFMSDIGMNPIIITYECGTCRSSKLKSAFELSSQSTAIVIVSKLRSIRSILGTVSGERHNAEMEICVKIGVHILAAIWKLRRHRRQLCPVRKSCCPSSHNAEIPPPAFPTIHIEHSCRITLQGRLCCPGLSVPPRNSDLSAF